MFGVVPDVEHNEKADLGPKMMRFLGGAQTDLEGTAMTAFSGPPMSLSDLVFSILDCVLCRKETMWGCME